MGEQRPMSATRAGDGLPEVDALLADPVGSARARAQSGERVIGLLGPDIPVELVIAAGARPVQLAAFAVADAATPNADRYLESSFLPAVRSIAEQWLTGAYDFLDAVVFTRSNDSVQRLYYYVCELQRRRLARGPRALLYDVAKIPRASSRRHTLAATVRLAEELGTRLPALPEAIAVRNRRREAFREVARLRTGDRPPRGSEVQRLLRASDLDAGERLDGALASWIEAQRARALARASSPRPHPRLLLAGSAPPDERLHVAVEQAGGCVIGEIGDHSTSRVGEPASRPAGESATAAGGEGFIEMLSSHHHALALGPRAFGDRAASVAEVAANAKADGVVVWLIEEDESMTWDVPRIERAIGSTGIPHLTLVRRRWDCRDGAIDAIGEFVRGLSPASGGNP